MWFYIGTFVWGFRPETTIIHKHELIPDSIFLVCWPPHPPGLNIGTCNIPYGRGFGLPQSIWAMQLGNYDLMLLTETKIPNVVYCQNLLRYNIVCSQEVGTAAGGEQGWVGLILRERPEGWIFESTCFHWPNVVICEIVSGKQQTPLIKL